MFPRDSIAKLEDIHTGGVLCCRVVHRDGAAYLLTSSADKTVKVTALASGQSSLLLDVNGATRDPALSPHAGPVLALCPHPLHADVFVTGSMDGSHALVRWSPPKSELLPSQQLPGEVLQRWSDHSKYVVRAEFSTTTGVYLATASYDRKVNIYRARDGYRSVYCDEGAIPHYEKLHTARFDTIVESLCFIDDKTLVIAVRDNNHLYYMDISEQDEGDGAPALVTDTRYNMNANGDDHVSFTAMHLSMSPPIVVDAHHPDGPVTQRFLLVSTDQESGRAILFQPHSAVQVQNFYGPRIDGYSQPRHCWHASGRYVFMTSDEDRAVWVFEVASGQCVRKLGGFKGELGDGDGEYSGEGHGSVVRSLWFDDVTARLYTGGFDKRVIVWK